MEGEAGKAVGTKAHISIIEELRRGIENGTYQRGEKLPTEKDLCEMFNTSRSSVREALSALEYIGLIDVRGGSGYYVSGNNPAEPEEIRFRCFAKVLASMDAGCSIKVMKSLFEQGVDAAVLRVTDCEDSRQNRQLRAIRQASIDANIPVAVLVEFSAADNHAVQHYAEFAVRAKVDGVIVSDVSSPQELLAVRRVFDAFETKILILARVANRDIAADAEQVSDGIVFNDLWVMDDRNAELLRVMMDRCNASGKLLFAGIAIRDALMAGGEVVSQIIGAGCDGVFINWEGAAQKYPGDILDKVKNGIKEAEARFWARTGRKPERTIASPLADALCAVAAHAAEAMKAVAFMVPTESGFTPRLLAKFRQRARIIAVSPHVHIVRQMRMVWGVQPLVSRRTLRQEDIIQLSVDTALQAGYLQEGDAVVGVVGNMDVPNIYNEIKLITVGDIILKGQGIGAGIVSGRVTIIKSRLDMDKAVRNKIVVIQATDAQHVPLMKEAAAFIVEEGGLSSHAAIAGLSLGKPVIVGAKDATELLLEDEQITLDVMRGLVYRGWVNLG